MTEAERTWREALASLALPEAIVAAAPTSPWTFPTDVFIARAERSAERLTVSVLRAREALPEGGSVLDVGAGAGAASLPLAPPATLIVAVDPSADLLTAFARIAGERGIAHEEIVGGWPEVADAAPPADVVVCDHVLYNVPELAAFARALDAHARRRVVIEISTEHPLAWMHDLWSRFHGIDRPAGPTADDALAVLREVAPRAVMEVSDREGSSGLPTREDAIAVVRTRLCLPPDRDEEIAAALGDRLRHDDDGWNAGPLVQRVATIWWDVAGTGSSG